MRAQEKGDTVNDKNTKGIKATPGTNANRDNKRTPGTKGSPNTKNGNGNGNGSENTETRKTRSDDDEPSVWMTAIKLLVGAVILIGGTGYALWYVDKVQEQENRRDPAKSAPLDWSISKDSPIHRLH